MFPFFSSIFKLKQGDGFNFIFPICRENNPLDYNFIFFKWVGSIQPPIRKKTSLDEVEAEDGNVKALV